VSGTYQYLDVPQTGSVHVAMWGVPCQTQTQPATGTVDVCESLYALQDSDILYLLDSEDECLVDSGGLDENALLDDGGDELRDDEGNYLLDDS